MIFESIFLNYFFFFKIGFLFFGKIFPLARFLKKIEDENFLKLSFGLFAISVLFLFSRVAYLFFEQYRVWQGTYFLPPFQPMGYFLSYSWLHFAKQPVFDICLGIFFFFLIWLGTKFSQGRFFYNEEKYTGGLAMLLNPWPVNILVFFLVILLGIFTYFLKLIFNQRKKDEILVNFRFFWIIMGGLLLFFGGFLTEILGLDVLMILKNI